MRTQRLDVGRQRQVPSFAQHLALTRSAIRFARRSHRAQLRACDEAPFILHPLEVGALLYNCGASDEVIAAGVLHDVIEDTGTVIDEVRRRFGDKVAMLVASVTEDPTIGPIRDRKAALRACVRRSGAEAGLIFAADKVAKVRELRTLFANQRVDEPMPDELLYKVEHYEASLQMLEELVPEQPLVRQLRFELEALETYPPGRQGLELHAVRFDAGVARLANGR